MRQARPNRALFVGLATLDLGYLVGRYPAEDTKNLADDHFMTAGGPAANAAVASAFLGDSAHLVTALGRHPLSEVVIDELTSRRVRVLDTIPAHDAPPPMSAITVSRRTGSRTIVSLDGSRLPRFSGGVADLPVELSRGWDVLLVDGHQPELSLAAAAAARAAGVPVVLDAGRWRPSHPDLLRHVDVAICSRSFDPPGIDHTDLAAIHAHLHDHGVPLVATTDGAAPISFSTPDDKGEIAVPQVEAADTLGAGDIFHGAFCHYYAHGATFTAALEQAATVASRSCTVFGPRAWMDRGRAAFPA
jgi:sugar/nucleoside kinase (ribokinase family)